MNRKGMLAAILLAIFTLLCVAEASFSVLKVVAGDRRTIKYVTGSGTHRE